MREKKKYKGDERKIRVKRQEKILERDKREKRKKDNGRM